MASVAPSPEVVVERSVVAGSVVEGGAGDVVVAGSLVAGPVVAGSPQHFCSYCGVWMSGDPESLRRHYEGTRHNDRVAIKKRRKLMLGHLLWELLRQLCLWELLLLLWRWLLLLPGRMLLLPVRE